MIITYTFTMARWQMVVKKSEATKQNKDQYTFTMARWQMVVKKSEATKQTKDQNNNNKQTNMCFTCDKLTLGSG